MECKFLPRCTPLGTWNFQGFFLNLLQKPGFLNKEEFPGKLKFPEWTGWSPLKLDSESLLFKLYFDRRFPSKSGMTVVTLNLIQSLSLLKQF